MSTSQHGPNANSRAALDDIDNAPLGWSHIRAVLIAGAGFFTDAYDIFAINIASVMIGYAFEPSGALSSTQDLGLKIATPVGTLCGQLLFGWLADVFGRKRIYGIELMIILTATLGQAVAGSGPATSYLGVLIMWRFIMGIGIGGDYPLSATITSEFAAKRIRGRMMNAVFGMQGFGNMAAAIVGLCVVRGFASAIAAGPSVASPYVDNAWRILIGLGIVPGSIALYFRLTIPETPHYARDMERNMNRAAIQDGKGAEKSDSDSGSNPQEPATPPKASWTEFFAHFGKWENGKVLFGCAWSWFALDVAFYGLGLNSSIVLQAIGYGTPASGTASERIVTNLTNICVGNIILAVAGLVPGYWVSFAFIDTWGRKPIQIMGFIMLTVLFVILGFAYHPLVNNAIGAFIFLYCLTNFFQNFGPNTTTFIMPAELFPTRFRSTAHGISAASGKFGAIIAQIFVFYVKDRGGKNQWIDHLLQIFALFMLTGIFSTLLVPETKGRSLEDFSDEDQFAANPSNETPTSSPSQEKV